MNLKLSNNGRIWRNELTGEWVFAVGGSHGTATFDQTGFRFYDDDGDETGSTAAAALNTNPTLAAATIFHARFIVAETAGISNNNQALQLEYNHNSGGWNNVTGSSSVIQAAPTANIADGSSTTQRIGNGTFITTNAGQDDVDGLAGGATLDYSGNDEAEAVFAFQIIEADVSANDTIELRVGALDFYNQTPTITVAQGPVEVTANTTLGGAAKVERTASTTLGGAAKARRTANNTLGGANSAWYEWPYINDTQVGCVLGGGALGDETGTSTLGGFTGFAQINSVTLGGVTGFAGQAGATLGAAVKFESSTSTTLGGEAGVGGEAVTTLGGISGFNEQGPTTLGGTAKVDRQTTGTLGGETGFTGQAVTTLGGEIPADEFEANTTLGGAVLGQESLIETLGGTVAASELSQLTLDGAVLGNESIAVALGGLAQGEESEQTSLGGTARAERTASTTLGGEVVFFGELSTTLGGEVGAAGGAISTTLGGEVFGMNVSTVLTGQTAAWHDWPCFDAGNASNGIGGTSSGINTGVCTLGGEIREGNFDAFVTIGGETRLGINSAVTLGGVSGIEEPPEIWEIQPSVANVWE